MTEITELNLPWQSSNFIVLDLEGTGAQHKQHEGIVEIAAIEINKKLLTENYFYKLLNPNIEIPSIVSKIHGLRNSDLINHPLIENIESELLDFINNKILVGHNVIVDYKLLKLRVPSYTPRLVMDTKKLSKHFYKNFSKHGLDKLIEEFGISKDLENLPIKRGRHSAYFDAYATGLIFLKMISENMKDSTTLRELYNICGLNINDNPAGQISMF